MGSGEVRDVLGWGCGKGVAVDRGAGVTALSCLGRCSPTVNGTVASRLGERHEGLRLVTDRGVISPTIVTTVNDLLAGGCTRNCPKGECCNNYRYISMIRRVTHRHTYRLFNTRRTGIRPRSNTRTGATMCFTVLGPNSAMVNVGLGRNNRLARNSPIGVSNGCFGFIPCNISPRAREVSCSGILRVTGRYGPGVVITNTSTCPEVVSFTGLHRVTSTINTCLVISVTRVTNLITTNIRPGPIPCYRFIAAAARGALHNPHNNLVLYHRRFTGRVSGTVFPNARNNPLVRIVTTGTIYFNRTLGPRFGRCNGGVISGYGTLTSKLLGENGGLISNNASGRILLVSLHSASMANGRLRTHLSSYCVAMGGGAVPNRPHSPFMADNMEVNATTIAAENLGRRSVSGVTRCVALILGSCRGDGRGIETNIRRVYGGCPLCRWS